MRPWNIQLWMRCPHQILPFRAQGTMRKWKQRIWEVRGIRGHQYSKGRTSKTTKQNSYEYTTEVAITGPALGLLHTYYSFQFSTFMRMCKQVDLWFLCLLLGLFYYSVGLSSPTDGFVLSYYISFCCVLLLFLRSLFFF